MNSQPTTRERLISAGTTVFAENGFRGAAVRDICNLARVNPGAISYHFGGKRQLYRAVLRSAVDHLAGVARDAAGERGRLGIRDGFMAVEKETRTGAPGPRLLLRDLADGGQMALEALAPVIRELQSAFADAHGASEEPAMRRHVTAALLTLAAPLLLSATAWPILEQTLQVDEEDREAMFDRAWR
jgi:AcrR family transcriptional regulator